MTIDIYRDDVWAGKGQVDKDGCIVDCSAVLGADQDASDKTYEAIADAIDADRYTRTGSVTRPDGEYSWAITAD